MGDYGIFESIEGSEGERKIASRDTQRKLDAAIDDVKRQYGAFLFGSRDGEEWNDRVALCKNDMIKTIDAHLMPVTGVVRRIVKACKDDWRQRTAWDQDGINDWAERHAPGSTGGGKHRAGGEDKKPVRDVQNASGLPRNPFPKTHKADKTGPELKPEGDWEAYLKSVGQSDSVDNCFKEGYRYADNGIGAAPDGPDAGTGMPAGDPISQAAATPVGIPGIQTARRFYAEEEDDTPDGWKLVPGGAPGTSLYRTLPGTQSGSSMGNSGIQVGPDGNKREVEFVGDGSQGQVGNQFNYNGNQFNDDEVSAFGGKAPSSAPSDAKFPTSLFGTPGDAPAPGAAAPGVAAAPVADQSAGGNGNGGNGAGAAIGGGGGGNGADGAFGGGGSGWQENNITDAINTQKYTAQEGDTLSDIAQRSGWGENYKGLADAAGIDNPDVINVGQEYDLGKPKGAAGGNDARDLSSAGGKWGAPAAQSADAAKAGMDAFGAEPAAAPAATPLSQQPAPAGTTSTPDATPGGPSVSATGQTPSVPEPGTGQGVLKATASLAVAQYIDWCDSFGARRASVDSLDKYAANLNDQAYFEIASALTDSSSPIYRTAGDFGGPGKGTHSGEDGKSVDPDVLKALMAEEQSAPKNTWGWSGGPALLDYRDASIRRTAAPDYLQKADEALTNLLNQKAEEFQETIQPLQQALQTVQQAEQAQAAMNPMGVQPPAGTVNVLPGQPDPAAGGMPPGGGDPSQGGGDPMAGLDPAMLQQLLGGGGDPSGGQGGPPPGDPSQQMMARRRVVNRGKGRGASSPKVADVVSDYNKGWGSDKVPGLPTGNPEVDLNKYETQTGKPLGPKQRNKLVKPVSTANPMPKSKRPITTPIAKQGSVESHYGDLDSDTGNGRIRGQRPRTSPFAGSDSSSSSLRSANSSREDSETQHQRKDLSRSQVGRKESNVAHPQSGNAGLSGGGQRSSGSSPQRPTSRQSARESGVRNPGAEFSGHGAPQNSVAAGQNSLSRRASAGVSKPHTKLSKEGASSMSGMLKGEEYGEGSSRTSAPKRGRSPLSKNNGQRLAWTGFGARKVPGWEFDSHLNGYVTTAARDFTCSCGEKLPVPSYSQCKCGKLHNSYVIGTGGDNHQASVEKFICREIPVRDNVIVARRKRQAMSDLGLNVTDSAPHPDKPLMLVYGGAFNPPHQGHVGALQDAHDTLAGAGYNVAGTIVAPTADKLLAHKEMAPEHRLGLQSRANVVRSAFPKDMNGAPIMVHTGPSEEVEQGLGKPRRTDLARWAQQHYPDHTIVNVTGEDAVVPGAPDIHPSIYSGAPGSNHEGFAYLTMPRDPDESMSSSKIRAALAAGQPLPGMTPESENAYREELAKLGGSIVAKRRKQAGGWQELLKRRGGGIVKYTEDEEEEPVRVGGKVKRHNLSDPGPLGNGKDDKMPDINDDLGQDWYKRGPGGKYARNNRRSR